MATGGGSNTISTIDQLVAAAPLAWPLKGTALKTAGQRVSVVQPEGWGNNATAAGRLVLGKPDGATFCQAFIFDPVAPAVGEQAQLEQLSDFVRQLYPAGVTLYGEYGSADLYRTRRRGTMGFGWKFVGAVMELKNASTRIHTWLAMFGAEAVPVVFLSPGGTSCLVSQLGQVDEATILHSLGLDTFTNTLTSYRDSVLGSWFSSSGSVGTLNAFAANHHYVTVSTLNGQIIEAGQLYDVSASWAGDGSYLVLGPVLGRFPAGSSKPPFSVLVRLYEEQNPSNTTQWECELRASSVDGSPYEHCLGKTN